MEKEKDIFSYKWAINRHLTLKEREILFLTIESAGMSVYPLTRTHAKMVIYPYIVYRMEEDDGYPIYADASITAKDNPLPYEWVLEQIQEKIKSIEIEYKE